jgi:hypothetical protein
LTRCDPFLFLGVGVAVLNKETLAGTLVGALEGKLVQVVNKRSRMFDGTMIKETSKKVKIAKHRVKS